MEFKKFTPFIFLILVSAFAFGLHCAAGLLLLASIFIYLILNGVYLAVFSNACQSQVLQTGDLLTSRFRGLH